MKLTVVLIVDLHKRGTFPVVSGLAVFGRFLVEYLTSERGKCLVIEKESPF